MYADLCTVLSLSLSPLAAASWLYYLGFWTKLEHFSTDVLRPGPDKTAMFCHIAPNSMSVGKKQEVESYIPSIKGIKALYLFPNKKKANSP